MLKCELHIHQKTRTDSKNWNRTTWCSYKIEKTQLVESNLVVETDELLLPSIETFKNSFSRWSLWRNRESLNPELLFSKNLSSGGGSRNWMFARQRGIRDLVGPGLFSTFPRLPKFWTHLQLVVRARGVFSMKLQCLSQQMLWNVFEHTRLQIKHFLNGKGKNVLIFLSVYVGKGGSQLSKKRKCDKTWRP